MAQGSANAEETLLQAIHTTPIIDNHAHPLLKLSAIDKYPLLAVATEAHADALSASQTSLAHFRAVKQLAGLLGCDSTWEAVSKAIEKKRQGNYEEWVERCLAGVETVLVDDGLDGPDNVEAFDYFDNFTRSPNKRIVRIEQLATLIVDEACRKHRTANEALAAVIDAYHRAIVASLADPNVVGFKSVICYRTGLAIPRSMDLGAATRAFRRIFDEQSMARGRRFARLQHEGLNEYFVHRLASLIRDDKGAFKKPIQFHTGLGDNDITLSKASPSHLQEFIREYPTVPVVLLHAGYPFTREIGYLATVYANVYADIGEVFPFLSRDGQEGVVRQILELCPGSKILWSTDGHWFPETYVLAVEQIRQALEVVLCEYVSKGDLTWTQAARLVEDVLFNNSNGLYQLGLELKPITNQIHARLSSPETGNSGILARFLKKQNEPRFLRVYWNDFTASPRMRVIPLRRVWDILRGGEELSFGVTKASLGLLQNDIPAEGVSPSEEYRLHPDLRTLRPGPRKGHITVRGDFKEKNGSAVDLCPRTLLKKTVEKASREGLAFLLGFEVELLLVRRNQNGKFDSLDLDGHAWSVGRVMEHDAAITVIEEAVEQLDAAGVFIEMVHPESANGQFELVLPKAPPLEAVDTLLYARDVISNCATAKGYRMTLHPKPFAMACGTAAHVHLSISSPGGSEPRVYEPFYAGILKHLRAIAALTYSNPVSYERVQDGCWAGGTWVAWGTQNRETPLRKIEGSHWELKCMDGLANPYLAVSSVLLAGLEGVINEERLIWGDCAQDPASLTDSERESLNMNTRLPRDLSEALEALKEDEEFSGWLGQSLVARYVAVKGGEMKLLGAMGEEERRQWIMERY